MMFVYHRRGEVNPYLLIDSENRFLKAMRMLELFMAAPDEPNGYTMVAEVDTEDLDVMFELTSNIHDCWSLAPERRVTPHNMRADGRAHRSTAVGDIVLDTKIGRLLFCKPSGWEVILSNDPPVAVQPTVSA